PIFISDLAEVREASALRIGAATAMGEGETVIGMVQMLAGENAQQVVGRVKTRVREIEAILPPGVMIEPYYDRTIFVSKVIRTVRNNLLEGGLLVMAVLFLFLGDLRAGVIVASAIPLSMLIAFSGMMQAGLSGNLMSLGAIDFGLLVDGSVVMVDNILRRLAKKGVMSPEERLSEIQAAGREVLRPMTLAVSIIILVYVPILALTGIEGKMFHPMALTVILALAGALLLSLTLMPVLCALMLRGKIHEGRNLVIRFAKSGYTHLLAVALRFRWIVIMAATILFAGSVWLFTRLGAEFVPKLDEGSITAMLYKPVGMSVEEALRTDIEVENRLLKEFPEITRIFSRIGTSDIATDPMPPNESDVYIFYKPLSEWPKTAGRP